MPLRFDVLPKLCIFFGCRHDHHYWLLCSASDNEELRDLLTVATERRPLKLIEDLKRGVICQNLEEFNVATMEDVLALLRRGIQARSTVSRLSTLQPQHATSRSLLFYILTCTHAPHPWAGFDVEESEQFPQPCHLQSARDYEGKQRRGRGGHHGPAQPRRPRRVRRTDGYQPAYTVYNLSKRFTPIIPCYFNLW